jgi:hypothetical protein
VKFGEKVDIAKFVSLPGPCNAALIKLPFSCYPLAGTMAKVEYKEDETNMPTILLLLGWRIFFYANEGNEPVHVHCRKGEKECKS